MDHQKYELFSFLDVPRTLTRHVRRIAYSNQDHVDLRIRVATAGYVYLGKVFRGTERSLEIWKGEQRFIEELPRNCIFGLATDNDFAIQCKGVHNQLVVEFTATGFYELFKCSPIPYENNIVNLIELAPELDAALNQIPDLGDNTDCLLRSVARCFDPLIRKSASLPVIVRELVKKIEKTNGLLSLIEEYEKLGRSPRYSANKFKAIVGLRPKTFARIRQMSYMLELIRLGRFDTLSVVAFEAGYTDQAYSIKTLREFAAVAPTSLLKNPDFEVLMAFLGGGKAP